MSFLVKLLVLGGSALVLSSFLPSADSTEYAVVDAYLGGAKPSDPELPTIVLLHAEDSTPTEALKTLVGDEWILGPARVLIPVGRVPTAHGTAYVQEPPMILVEEEKKAAYRKAQRDEMLRLATWMQGVKGSKPSRVIVIGLGSNGTISTGLGLGLPTQVRQAYGTGGSFPSSDVPAAAAQLALPTPIVRKISYGDAIAIDETAAKLAQERGFDFDTMTLFEPPSPGVVRKWLLPQLDGRLTLP